MSVAGTWRLESFAVHDEQGAVVFHPMGEDPAGVLVYTEDGWMSVHLSYSGRPHFAGTSQRAGSTEEKSAAMETYFSYAGRYEFTGDKVLHHIEISSFPNWVGTEQWREPELDGDLLTLRTPAVDGKRSTLVWRRVRKTG
ncbi:lipocalin-like domain-containing protein [Allokutzneria oryzae]|uniref:Lipocalin-like domain-containing protein n=1 Tax=Allokutzneria oryzae TaxID=1378989 RepID=A0ABV5ZTR0_9PSEU